MTLLLFAALAGAIIVVLILKFDKKQTVKVNAVLKQNRSVPPLLLLKSTEQKVKVLKAALRYDEFPKNTPATADSYHTPKELARQAKVQQFKLIIAKYNSGQISLDAYNAKIDNLLNQLEREKDTVSLAF